MFKDVPNKRASHAHKNACFNPTHPALPYTDRDRERAREGRTLPDPDYVLYINM